MAESRVMALLCGTCSACPGLRMDSKSKSETTRTKAWMESDFAWQYLREVLLLVLGVVSGGLSYVQELRKVTFTFG